ncbi:hypothetical protein TIFTF001_051489 [Ficus carica]|uniref:Uncharacterized protein n=1 Tax=Ficus carica TaxID=3494 RepID=A0AA87ZKW6_FICCA|nr:hypothetical protein TIFTF001_051489 [Ficus carica]
MSFAIRSAAQQLGIPLVMFFPVAARTIMGLKQFRPLLEKGILPLKEIVEKTFEASAVVIHTFDALERDLLDAHSSTLPNILWKEETECLEWLNTQKPNSVIYVNFGGITVSTPQQVVEFGWGLANSLFVMSGMLALEIDNDLKSGQVETLVGELMEKEKGKKMKSMAMEWKNLAEEATGAQGSSSMNFDNLVSQVLLPKN